MNLRRKLVHHQRRETPRLRVDDEASKDAKVLGYNNPVTHTQARGVQCLPERQLSSCWKNFFSRVLPHQDLHHPLPLRPLEVVGEDSPA